MLVSTLNNTSQAELIRKQYDSITAGNEMKWDVIEPSEGKFNFTNADTIADFAQYSGMKLRGHTLLWHNQVPNWLFKGPDGQTGTAIRDLLIKRLKNHIETEVTHYKGKIYTWDVVNEVLSDKSAGLRGEDENSHWKSIIGDADGDGYDSDFIELAFKYAHEADPNALLAINDYNLESSTTKADAMYDLVKRLKAKGVPIDVIGMQMHISIAYPSVSQVKQAIEKFASLGVKVEVTELDMSIYSSPSEQEKKATDSILSDQAQKYKELFDLFKEESQKGNLISVTFWGSADNDTWLDNFPVKGRLDAPLLFDRELQPKPAYWAIVNSNKLKSHK